MALAGSKPLTNTRQELFVQGILKGLPANRAYVAAGYADKNADSNATRLMGNERVSARVQYLQSKVADRVVAKAVLNRDEVLRRLDRNSEDAHAAGEFSASNQALNLIGKELGMFVEQVKDVSDPARVPSSEPASGLRAAGTLLVGAFGKPKA